MAPPKSSQSRTTISSKKSRTGIQENYTAQDKAKKAELSQQIIDNNRLHSLFPLGLPRYSKTQRKKFIYDWDTTKGEERRDRETERKPLAVPLDDEYLSIMPPTTADFTWVRLKSKKKRPSLEDFNNTPEVIFPQAMATQTIPPSITPSPINPAIPKSGTKKSLPKSNQPLIPNKPLPDKKILGPAALLKCKSISELTPPNNPMPRRRTLVERTDDYKRCVYRPVKVTCIRPCPCIRENRRETTPWRICWDCGLVYRKELSPRTRCPPLPKTCNCEFCESNNTTKTEDTTLSFRLNPLINVYQRQTEPANIIPSNSNESSCEQNNSEASVSLFSDIKTGDKVSDGSGSSSSEGIQRNTDSSEENKFLHDS